MPDIYIDKVHFSDLCDKVNDTDSYGGILVYDCGTYEGKGSTDIYKGYCIIKDANAVSKMPLAPGEEGIFCGRICHFLLGCQPSHIAACGGAMAGFNIE